jgi:hypothetical protein
MKLATMDWTNLADTVRRIILAHDLKGSDSQELLETIVKEGCLASNFAASEGETKTAEVSFRMSVYRFNRKTIGKKGKFDHKVGKLHDKVQSLLVSESQVYNVTLTY